MRLPPIVVTADDSVIHVCFRGESTDIEYDGYLDDLRRLLISRPPRARKCVLINDASERFRATQAQNQRQSAWTRQYVGMLRRNLSAMLYVVGDPFARNVLASVLKLNPPPLPHEIFTSLADARARVHALRWHAV